MPIILKLTVICKLLVMSLETKHKIQSFWKMSHVLLKFKLGRTKGGKMNIKDAKRMSKTLRERERETYTLSTYLDVVLSELVHLEQRKTETNTQKHTCAHKAAGNYTNMPSVSHTHIYSYTYTCWT